jgi:hypothetical protein
VPSKAVGSGEIPAWLRQYWQVLVEHATVEFGLRLLNVATDTNDEATMQPTVLVAATGPLASVRSTGDTDAPARNMARRLRRDVPCAWEVCSGSAWGAALCDSLSIHTLQPALVLMNRL